MPATPRNAAEVLDDVIKSRASVRAFRPDAVPRRLLADILETASYAPSNFNSQPWRVYVLTGAAKQGLSAAILQAFHGNALPAFSPFPQPNPTVHAARVADFGRRYYSTLGIDQEDMQARLGQTARNYIFFDAPVGLIFTINAAMTHHSWLDQGLFIQNIMLAAHTRGLATCPQVSFVRFRSVIAEHLALATDELVTCGMSLGFPEIEAAVNQMNMPRAPVEDFVNWLGFEK